MIKTTWSDIRGSRRQISLMGSSTCYSQDVEVKVLNNSPQGYHFYKNNCISRTFIKMEIKGE